MKKITLLLIVLSIIFVGCSSSKDDTYDYEKLMGNKYLLSDESYLVLNEDKTFKWYKTKEDLKDNYYYGHYTVYRGENAIKYISEDLAIYDLTEKKQREYISGDTNISIDMYFSLNLYNEYAIVNGLKKELSSYTHFYGTTDGNYQEYKMINMLNSNYGFFTLEE